MQIKTLIVIFLAGAVFLCHELSGRDAARDRIELSSEQIATKVKQVLEEARYLHMKGAVQYTKSGSVLTFDAHMGRGLLKAKVYKEGQLFMAFGLQNGREQEFRPQAKKRPLLEYDAPNPEGSDDTVFSTDWDCMVGDLLSSWVGPNAHQSDYFQRHISAGKRLADAQVNGKPCYVIKDLRAGEDSDTEHNYLCFTYFVDKETFLVTRQEAINNGVHRINTYQLFEAADMPADFQWRITAEEK